MFTRQESTKKLLFRTERMMSAHFDQLRKANDKSQSKFQSSSTKQLANTFYANERKGNTFVKSQSKVQDHHKIRSKSSFKLLLTASRAKPQSLFMSTADIMKQKAKEKPIQIKTQEEEKRQSMTLDLLKDLKTKSKNKPSKSRLYTQNSPQSFLKVLNICDSIGDNNLWQKKLQLQNVVNEKILFQNSNTEHEKTKMIQERKDLEARLRVQLEAKIAAEYQEKYNRLRTSPKEKEKFKNYSEITEGIKQVVLKTDKQVDRPPSANKKIDKNQINKNQDKNKTIKSTLSKANGKQCFADIVEDLSLIEFKTTKQQANSPQQDKFSKADPRQQQLKQKPPLISRKSQEQIQQLKNKISQITQLGEVASYCSQTLKKSKLEWHRAALFLYKYSYECLKAFEEEYISARKRNEIEQEELTILQEENELVKQQLVKVKTFVDKKVKLSPEEIKLVELTTNQRDELIEPIQDQISHYIKSLDESGNKKDPHALRIALRMINSVFIIDQQRRKSKIQLLPNIDTISQTELVSQYEIARTRFVKFVKM